MRQNAKQMLSCLFRYPQVDKLINYEGTQKKKLFIISRSEKVNKNYVMKNLLFVKKMADQLRMSVKFIRGLLDRFFFMFFV